ncbi:RHS repeat-associated core domain-containing protein [Lysobacter sp. GCM10012299]|uniref:RHS repeat-associated core domain-containing protein n=1 Tax=Lysobacter sp. GCM10012299 TaxID=3317333 RepID=UPI003615BD35
MDAADELPDQELLRALTGGPNGFGGKNMMINRSTLAVGIALSLAGPVPAMAGVTHEIRYQYDDLGRLVAQHGNAGQVTRYTYDNEDRVTAVTDALNRTTRMSYDALGRVVRSIDPSGVASAFAYDANNQLVSVTDPRGQVTAYEKDGFGQTWKQVSPDTGVTTVEYNAAGLPTRMTRNNGGVTTYAHDGLGRLTQARAGSAERNFGYDSCTGGQGRLCVAEVRETGAVKNTVTQAYSPQGWLTRRRVSGVDEAGQSYDGTTAYAFDGLGRVSGISYPSGVSVGYGYHSGRLATMTATINGISQTVASNLTYQPFGPANGWSYGNGLERLVNFDTDGRVFGISAGDGNALVQSLTYDHNAADEIIAITNGLDAGQTRNYQYDVLGRLAKETAKGAEWSYDANGNRTHGLEAGVLTTYDVDPASNRLFGYNNPSGTHSYSYDALGNRTGETAPGLTATYTYDGFNRMRVATINGASSNYTVNALGQRIGKSTAAGRTRFVYAGQNQLLAEHGGAGWTSYLWLGNQVVGLVKPDQQLRFVHTDHVGRPEAVTNNAKQVVWRAGNEAWARATKSDAIGGLNLGFPGQYHDAESGLWSNGFRDGYDASLGAYTQPDPIGLAGVSFSTYAYANGNPVQRIDPLGLQDTFVYGEIDFVPVIGAEISGGLVIDWDTPMDSGLFVSPALAGGVNFGAALGAGHVTGDIEGDGESLDSNIVEYSPTVLIDDKGEIQGGAISIGPGIGASYSRGKTYTLSPNAILRALGFRRPAIKNPLVATVCTDGDCVTQEIPREEKPSPPNPAGPNGGGREGGGGNYGGGGGFMGGGGCYGNCGGGGGRGPGQVNVGPDVPVKDK